MLVSRAVCQRALWSCLQEGIAWQNPRRCQPSGLRRAFLKTATRVQLNHAVRLISTGDSLRDARLSTVAQTAVDNSRQDAVVESVQLADGLLKVRWGDRTEEQYPFIWLRDNCQCPDCFHPTTLSRQLVLRNIDLDVKPRSAQVTNDNHGVEVVWQDGHVSAYNDQWLRQYGFSDGARDCRRLLELPEEVHWSSSDMKEVPSDTWDELMLSDEALENLLFELARKGIVLIKGCPTQSEDGVKQLTKRVAFTRSTNYGEYFSVRVKNNPSNLAYALNMLGLHTDLPFYESAKFVQVLHCIHQSGAGGDSWFADGFYAANVLREEQPKFFQALTTIPVEFIDIGTEHRDFHLIDSHPTITLAEDGTLVTVSNNDAVRSPGVDANPQDTRLLYQALHAYNVLLFSPRCRINFRLQPGDIAMFANHRVLHGRDQIVMKGGDQRFLHGTYWMWNDVMSTYRVLRNQRRKRDLS